MNEEEKIVNKIVNGEGKVTDTKGNVLDLVNIDVTSICDTIHASNPFIPGENIPNTPDYNPDEPDEIEDIINETTGNDSLIPQ